MGDSTFRSWGGTASAEDIAAEQRRERRRRWIRPQSLAIVVGLIVLDVGVVVVASALSGASRARKDQPCATLWTTLAHDQTVGLWIVGVTLAATVLLALRWRWVLAATLVVQLVAAAILIPPILQRRADYTAVAEGRLPTIAVDSGGVACSDA